MTLKEILSAMASSIKNNYVSKKELGNLGKHYSVIIDFSKSDPGGMISYADDSDAAAAMSTDWFDILGLKLCVLKDGKVLYYLNPNNVTKQINGAAADITTLGNDVMLEVPRMGTNCIWINRDKLKITITTAPNRAGYDYRAFSLHRYNDCDKIYIGRYEAYATGNKMYSSSGKTPMVSQTLAQHRTYATNRGTGYTDIGICDNILLQCLYLLITKNFNSQAIIGYGIVDNENIHNTGEANTFGWLNTKSSNKNNGALAICCLGIENFWGNTFTWEDGLIKAANTNAISMAQYADQYNSDGTGYETIISNVVLNPDGSTNAFHDWPSRVLGLPKFIFMVSRDSFTASNRGETTYMCDHSFYEPDVVTSSLVGGRAINGSGAGVFKRNLNTALTETTDYVGSRLVYKHVEGGA